MESAISGSSQTPLASGKSALASAQKMKVTPCRPGVPSIATNFGVCLCCSSCSSHSSTCAVTIFQPSSSLRGSRNSPDVRGEGENTPILPSHHQHCVCQRGTLDAQQHAPSLDQGAPPEARSKHPVVHLIEHRGLRYILSRRHEFLRQGDPNRAPQNLKQNPYSAVVIEALELPNEVSEGTRHHLNRLPLFQVEVEADVSIKICGCN